MVDNEERLAFLDGILDSQINLVMITRKISTGVVQNENTTGSSIAYTVLRI